MTGRIQNDFDYSTFEADRRSFGFRTGWRKFAKLHRLSRRVAFAHGITNPKALEAHLDLVLVLWKHMGTQSRTYLQNGKIKIAADTQDLTSVTEDILPKLNKHLSKATEVLHEAEGNEVFLALLEDAAPDDENPGDQIGGLFRLAETISKAKRFKGDRGKKRNPDWVKEFCISCQRFWYEQGLGPTRLNFAATTPPAICNWAEQLFSELRQLRMDVDPSFRHPRASLPSALKTEAKDLPAFDPQKPG